MSTCLRSPVEHGQLFILENPGKSGKGDVVVLGFMKKNVWLEAEVAIEWWAPGVKHVAMFSTFAGIINKQHLCY